MYDDLQAVEFTPFETSKTTEGMFRRADVPDTILYDVRKDFLDRSIAHVRVSNLEVWKTAIEYAFKFMRIVKKEYVVVDNRKKDGVIYAAVANKEYFGAFDTATGVGYVCNELRRVNKGVTAMSIFMALRSRWFNGSSVIARSTESDESPLFFMPLGVRYRDPFVISQK